MYVCMYLSVIEFASLYSKDYGFGEGMRNDAGYMDIDLV